MLHFSNLIFYTIIYNPKYISVTHLFLCDNCLNFFCYSKRNLLINWWSDKYIHNNVSQASINFLKIMLSIGLFGIILKISSFPSVRFEITREIHKMK